jgi:Dyp-type peroxidase family
VTALDRDDIQGNVLRGYGFPLARYLFARVREPAPARRWLAAQADPVTAEREWDREPSPARNVALSFAGLEALRLPAHVLDSFPEDFRHGMAARARQLGDVGAAAPERWQADLRPGTLHVLVTLAGRDGPALEEAAGRVRAEMAANGLEPGAHQCAALLEANREHFGFTDGFGQPAIAGVRDGTPGQGVPIRRRPWHRRRADVVPSRADRRLAWRALRAGEFVLGYDDEDGGPPPAPAAPFGRNGTYMVWRKLHQDVALFRRTLREASAGYEQGDEHALAAKIVGRWRNGTPLVDSPLAERRGFDASAPGANDFRYGDVDLDGRRCPLGAHIRRSNPRDTLGFAGKLSFRHRIIRRGMPYGPPLPRGDLDDDRQERGLAFVCFNASISRQFESVQRQWLNDGNVFHLGRDTDFLLGAAAEANGKMTVQGEPPFFFSPQAPFVITRGGEYLFVPGMTGLAAIADGVTR